MHCFDFERNYRIEAYNALKNYVIKNIAISLKNGYNFYMEFQLEIWLQDFTKKLFDEFSSRIKFIGLQGSYNRGEATPESDIDIVIIIDKLSFEDLTAYKKIVASMPYSEKVCGFISGEKEIYNWPKFDLFQLLNDTVSLHGNLQDFIPVIKRNDILDSIKINTANLYHQMCHSYLFENKNTKVLYQGYKSVFFILQALYYSRNTEYIGSKNELVNLLEGEDKEVLLVNMNWKSLNVSANSDFYFEKIINWASKNI